MDAKIKDAFNEVRKLVKMHEALQTIAASFDALTLAQQTKEEHALAVSVLKTDAKNLAEANHEAKAKAVSILEEAHATATAVRGQAEEEAEQVLLSARSQASILSDELVSARKAVKEQIIAEEKRLEDVRARTVSAQKEFQLLEKKLTDMKDKIVNLAAQV